MTMQITIDQLSRTPAFAKAFRQFEAEQLAERQAQIDALAGFREQWHAEVEASCEKARAAAVRLDEAHALLATAQAEYASANSTALWRATRATAQERELEAAIIAGADARLLQFRAWADRAKNLAQCSTFESATAGCAASPIKTRRALATGALCSDAVKRADAMRLQAIAGDELVTELDDMAAGITASLDALGGQTPGRLPRDWRAPLM